MTDVLIRALKHPFAYIGVFRKRTILFKEMIHEYGDIYTFVFSVKKPFSWNAGEHGIFYFSNTPIAGKWWRAFSIASVPDEHEIRIATIIHEEPSDFKKHLQALKVGDPLILRGPFGEMSVKPYMQQIIGIAGGIGITPFRALIKAITEGAYPHTKLTLIFSAPDFYTFKNDFDILLPHPQLEIIYTKTPDEVNRELDRLTAQHHNTAYYFISGSPGMIGALHATLEKKGITKIVNDTFKGY